jgi:predicted nucleotidyltransferase component of viral defense system
MITEPYKKQLALLLAVLPEVAKENSVALHGGTAINLFVRDMPRLSVDIDLTYLPIEDRATSLTNIAIALERIKTTIEKVLPDVHVDHKKEIGKLQISTKGALVKLEVNPVIRGSIAAPVKMTLCDKAQNQFEAFCAMSIVPLAQLYGGKICAALDRQHPRDLFDVKYLLKNEGFTDEIKKGFFLCLLSGDRPINNVLSPNFQDQRLAMENQFSGMSNEPFSYEEYEHVRKTLVETVHKSLAEEDKNFLLGFKNLTPDWSVYDFERFPAIAWKLQNLKRLKESNPEKHEKQYQELKKKINVI